MTPLQIAAECARLEAVTAAKGYYMPKIAVRLNWLSYELNAYLETRTDAHASPKYTWIYATYEDGFDALFRRIEAAVNALVSIEDAKRNEFIAAVGRLIGQGKEIGIEVDFLNPLTEMMTKLSTNIITKQDMPF